MKPPALLRTLDEARLQNFTPPTLIAGTVPLAKEADAVTVAYHAAAFALDSERIKLVVQAAPGRVHYLAAPASEFIGMAIDRALGTPLALALDKLTQPDCEAFACVEADDAGATAVVYAQGVLSSYRGYTAVVEQHLKDQHANLPVEDVTELAPTRPWLGRRELALHEASRATWISAALAGSVCLLATAVLLAGPVLQRWRAGGSASPAIQSANESLRSSMDDTVRRANAPTLSASYTFFELQRLSSMAADSGGRIVRFVQEGSRVAWELRVPAWVTQDMLSQFGSDIHVRRDGEHLLVRRGLLDREDETRQTATRAQQEAAQQGPKPGTLNLPAGAAPGAER